MNRKAASLFASTALIVLAAGCGSGSPPAPDAGGSTSNSPSAGTSASAATPSAVAYSTCMRSHGVPNFPDPPSSGTVPKGGAQQFGVSGSVFQAAETACQPLFPTSGGSIQDCEDTGDCPPAVVQNALTLMRRYAECLRSHGVPNFPDPTIGSQGRPYFDVSGAGITYQYTHSAVFAAKDGECERLVGGSAGVPVPLG
jgi:hypothetical protein